MHSGQPSLLAGMACLDRFFAKATPLFPSNVINQQTFADLFGFPIQLFRALMAVAAALFVIRFLRAFKVETDRKIADLQAGTSGRVAAA